MSVAQGGNQQTHTYTTPTPVMISPPLYSEKPLHRSQVPGWSLPIRCGPAGVGGADAEIHAGQGEKTEVMWF